MSVFRYTDHMCPTTQSVLKPLCFPDILLLRGRRPHNALLLNTPRANDLTSLLSRAPRFAFEGPRVERRFLISTVMVGEHCSCEAVNPWLLYVACLNSRAWYLPDQYKGGFCAIPRYLPSNMSPSPRTLQNGKQCRRGNRMTQVAPAIKGLGTDD